MVEGRREGVGAQKRWGRTCLYSFDEWPYKAVWKETLTVLRSQSIAIASGLHIFCVTWRRSGSNEKSEAIT